MSFPFGKSWPFGKKVFARARRATRTPIDPMGQRLIGMTRDTGEPLWAPKGHSLLLAANGAGKTTAGAMPWIFSLLASSRRKALLVMDSKDGELAAQCAEMIADLGIFVAVIDDMGVFPADYPFRDQFKARFGETMNQMRETLKTREANIPLSGHELALDHALMIEPLIRDGDTMPFYRAHDVAGGALAEKLNITEAGAKRLMSDAYSKNEGQELYDHGKALEKQFHQPVREAAQQAREVKRDQARSRARV